MMKLIDRLTGAERLTVMENQRVLVLEKGRFRAILGPGEHRVKRGVTHAASFDLNGEQRFISSYAEALKRERPDLWDAHLVEFAAPEDEALVILREGRVWHLVKPGTRTAYWKAMGPWEAERIALGAVPLLPKGLGARLERAGITRELTAVTVPEAHLGLLTVDGALEADLAPGVHHLWAFGPKAEVRLIDLRWQAHEVTGQEILTRDRVTLRVNLTATYRVRDARRAVTEAKDFAEALHRALQLAFRKTLGALSLDALLADKVAVDAAAADAVRAEMAGIGLEVGEIALKDVILPGEMREILNRVVAAEKEAEANVIRRREETNAVRSLQNTAKVMADNPIMLRLKELEALETIAGKVERLTVHNGTAGLLGDIARLRD